MKTGRSLLPIIVELRVPTNKNGIGAYHALSKHRGKDAPTDKSRPFTFDSIQPIVRDQFAAKRFPGRLAVRMAGRHMHRQPIAVADQRTPGLVGDCHFDPTPIRDHSRSNAQRKNQQHESLPTTVAGFHSCRADGTPLRQDSPSSSEHP